MAKKKKSSGNKSRDWIIRIVIFGVLGVVLILAALDFRAKSQATETSEVWVEMLNDANENKAGVLPIQDLEEGIVGSPEVTKEEAGSNGTNHVYTWNGIFREYKVTVTTNSGTKYSSVNRIEGLGDSEAE